MIRLGRGLGRGRRFGWGRRLGIRRGMHPFGIGKGNRPRRICRFK